LQLALSLHTSFPRTRESRGFGTDHWIPDVSGMTEEVDFLILLPLLRAFFDKWGFVTL